MMSLVDYITTNFALLFLIFGGFVLLSLSKEKRATKRLMLITLAALLGLSISDYLEVFYASLPFWNYPRVITSFFGYILRPLIAYGLVSMTKVSQKRLVSYSIPLFVNLAIYATALFGSDMAFSFTETNNFQRGSFGMFAFYVSVFYILLVVVSTFIQIKRRKIVEGLLVMLASVMCCLAMFVDSKMGVSCLNLTIAISLVFYTMFRNIVKGNEYFVAETANKIKTAFLFNMSHDIRTPMNAVLGFTDLAIKNQDNKEKQVEYLHNVQTSGQQLLDLLNNVLEMTLLENNSMEISTTLANIEPYKDDFLIIFQNDIKEKNLTCNVDWNVIHKHLYIDKAHVEEIFVNIISNAIKYTPENGRVDISINELPGNTNDDCVIEFIVKDTGIGIKKEFLEHIYEMFTREKNTTDSGINGTGLGLGVVKRLVDLLQGDINVESEVGHGTTVTVHIPVMVGHIDEEEENINVQDIILDGRRVLMAEDNDLNAEIAEEILSDFDIKVDRAENGRICVDMLNDADDGYYDLILMDIQMPEMNGYDATKAIRLLDDEIRKNIPIIALTANAFETDKENAYEVGMNGFVAKPIDIQKLIDEMKRVIAKHQK